MRAPGGHALIKITEPDMEKGEYQESAVYEKRCGKEEHETSRDQDVADNGHPHHGKG